MIENLEEQILWNCRFCTRPDKSRIIYETSNFYVMLSLGPIVEGYCLLISKNHFSCCAAIPIDLREEFKEVYSIIKKVLNNVYGTCLCYEHGRAGACLIPMEGNKHCYHAHMHFVPIATPLNEIVQRDFDEISVKTMELFFEEYCLRNNVPYLFVDDGQSKSLYFIDQPIRRQYLRYKAALSIGKEGLWDWINHQGWELIESALKILPKHFNSIKNE